MQTIYYIANDWDDRKFCILDQAWVNDGRDTAMFKTEAEATAALDFVPEKDRPRCAVGSFEFEPDDVAEMAAGRAKAIGGPVATPTEVARTRDHLTTRPKSGPKL